MMEDYKGILVYIEMKSGVVNETSYELLGKAATLSLVTEEVVKAVVIGYDIKPELYEELIQRGADEVIVVSHPLLKDYLNTYYASALTQVVEKIKPSMVMVGATSIGRDIAPRISTHLKTGLTADCTKLEIDDITGNLLMTRPAFGGNIMATITCPACRPQMTTVRQGVFVKNERDHQRLGTVTAFEPTLERQSQITILEEVIEEKKVKTIEKSNLLISCGRGIGDKEKMPLYEKLADRLDGCLSGSRALVNLGYVDKDRQVGQTGKTVRPDFYMACGISGAVQHLVGMEESDYIIAINRDEKAPIFGVSDVGIVGDVNEIIEEVLTLLEV